jgi:hypothetical protein
LGIIEPHISQNTSIDYQDIAFYFALIIVLMLLAIWFTQFWLNLFYGKHLKQVKGILDELNVNVE